MEILKISPQLQEWLRRNRSRAVQAAVENDFNRANYARTFLDSVPPIPDGDPGAGNVEEPEEEE